MFAPAIKKRNAVLARIFSLDLDDIKGLASVRSFGELDQLKLRNVSEWLAGDLELMSQEIGLDKPNLGN